jgi:hypothetical protein
MEAISCSDNVQKIKFNFITLIFVQVPVHLFFLGGNINLNFNLHYSFVFIKNHLLCTVFIPRMYNNNIASTYLTCVYSNFYILFKVIQGVSKLANSEFRAW